MIPWLKKNWFLVGLLSVLLVGWMLHRQLDALTEYGFIKNAVVFAVLFVMTLPLPAETIWKVLRRPWAALLASVLNMGLVPLLAWVGSKFLSVELGEGLIVAAAAPCTVASAAVWTRKAGGNDAVAILVTILTNMTCFILTPAWVFALAATEDVSIDFVQMVQKLGWLVLLPMVLAQITRLIPTVGKRTTPWKIPLSFAAQGGILYIVFVGIIETSGHLSSDAAGAGGAFSLLWIVILVSSIHVAALVIGFAIAKMLRFGREEQIAVGFASSQKTLLIGLSVALEIQASILPMVAYHVCQLLIDTVIANRLSETGRRNAVPDSPGGEPLGTEKPQGVPAEESGGSREYGHKSDDRPKA